MITPIGLIRKIQPLKKVLIRKSLFQIHRKSAILAERNGVDMVRTLSCGPDGKAWVLDPAEVIHMNYQDINAKTIDVWCESGWQWGRAISHEEYQKALNGAWDVLLTPTKPVPHDWFGDLNGKRILGLASGGGQQIPIFSALGAKCTVLDYSGQQCRREREVAEREGYDVEVIQFDMTKKLPFEDETFDLIFHPVSNCYVEKVKPIFKECFRVLKKGGVLLCGLDNGINFIFDDTETAVTYKLPFNPLTDPHQYEESVKNDWGIQFSHTLEEQIGGQIEAGFILTNLYEDTNGEGKLHEFNIPSFFATRAIKPC